MNYDAKLSPVEGTGGVAPNPLTVSDEEDRRARRRMWIIAALVLALLIGVWFLMHRGGDDQLTATGASQAPVVTVVTPGNTTVANRISATGSLAARRRMPVGSVGEGGAVVNVLVDSGQWVKAGQVLAVVDSSVQTQQAASLEAQIRVAEADARLAQSNLDRALQLVERGFISKADIDRLTATRDADAARVRVARAQLAETRARNRRLNIVAPAAGLLLERNVEPGQVVGAGSGELFAIARDGEIEMLARLSEDDLARISTGVAATVTPVGSPRSFSGQVWQIAPVIDPQTRLGQARIALAYSPELRPGGFATAEIEAGSTVAPLLPESAVLSDAKGSYVFIVDGDNKVARRNVTTGTFGAGGIAIADGLTGKERVVLRAGAFLAEGETVKPRQVAK